MEKGSFDDEISINDHAASSKFKPSSPTRNDPKLQTHLPSTLLKSDQDPYKIMVGTQKIQVNRFDDTHKKDTDSFNEVHTLTAGSASKIRISKPSNKQVIHLT